MDMRGTLDLLETLANAVETESLADDALEAAIKHVQERLGVESGDVAAQFFTGKAEDVIKRVLIKYIEQEIEMLDDNVLDEYLDDTANTNMNEYLDDTANTKESYGGAMTGFKP
jgi:hypothetical protein